MQSISIFRWRIFSTVYNFNPLISFSALVLADAFSLTSYSHRHNVKNGCLLCCDAV